MLDITVKTKQTMKHLNLLLLIPFLLTSCTEAKMLSKSLNRYQVPLGYLHDSRVIDCDRSTSISIVDFDNSVFDSATTVTKINQKILPFIIYNYTEVNLAVNMGQSSLTQNYSDFFKESFLAESQRIGCFSLTDDPTKYTLEISFDTVKINSKYQRSSTVLFFLIAYSMYFHETGFPAEARLALNVRLRKGRDLIFEEEYFVYREQPFLSNQMRNVNQLRSNFVTNMAESLSLNTKESIEQIIKDINLAIENR